MKKFYLNLKFLLLLIFSLSSSNILAYDYSEVNSDGKTIYYDIISTRDLTASVVRSNYSYLYDGDINIPSTIEYAGNTYSVITIEAKAFQNCFNITSITIPNSVTTIGANAFDGCYGLTSITIPNSVTTIGANAFFGCDGLTSITIPNSVTTIGDNAFYGCDGLTSITIPNSVTTIGANAFHGCYGLTSITIPNSVTTIGANAFHGCYGLTTLTIPSSVTKIENSAFNLCTKLSTLIIEDGVENLTLGYNSYNSSGVGRGLFYDCPIDTLYLGRDISYYTSKESGYSPFYDLPTLTSVTIGDRVTTIGSYTFSNCTNLSSIDLPENITTIGNYAFSNCTNLSSIDLSENITTIGSYAFSNCTNLSSIIISDGLSSIGTNAFLKTPFLLNQPTDTLIYFGKVLYKYNGTMPADTDIEIQQGTLSIAGSAFSGCEGLTNITIPNSVKIVGANAFNGCSGLTSITIPESVTSIEKDAFGGCSSLSNLVFENGDNNLEIASIEMFSSCPLKTLYLGRNVEYPLFSGKDLISVVIGKSVTQIPTNTFTGCSEIKSIVFEDGEVPLELGWSEQSISNSKGLFYNSSYLEYLYIGRDLIQLLNNNTTYKKENNSPFSRCYSLFGVTFGETVTTIPDYIFYNGTATHITCLSSQPYIINDNTFLTEESSFPHKYMEIAVPIGALETYKSADFWKRYESICMFYIKDGIEYNIYEDKSIVYRCYDDNISEPNIIDKIEVDGFDYNITEIRYGAFADHSSITSVTIPNGITSIGNTAFWNCDSLSSITIPNSVTSIGEGVFVGCTSLTSITIPENVQHIGYMAFRDCTGLQEIYSLNPTPPSSPTYPPLQFFYNVDTTIPVYIPVGSKSAYQAAPEWKNFTNFIESEFTGVEEETISTTDIKVIAGNGVEIKDYYGNLRIVNLSGQVVKDIYVNGYAQITLPKGIYIVVTENNAQKVVL